MTISLLLCYTKIYKDSIGGKFMRIMAENDSAMEQDIIVANTLLNDIKTAYLELKKVVNFKTKSASRVGELQQKKQDLNEKLASINNSLNVQRLYKYELKDQLSRLPKLDIKSRVKFIKKFKSINDCRRNLKEMRARTESDLAECERLIERRKSIKVHENLSSYTLTLVANLYSKLNEYRAFRKDFFDLHGLSLPSVNLDDLVRRGEDNQVKLNDFEIPNIIFMPFIDEELQIILNFDPTGELEVYEI